MSNHPVNLCFDLLKSMVEPRRAAFRRPRTYAFAVMDAGGFVLDTSNPQLVESTYRQGCDVSILCNTLTMRDLVRGSLSLDNLQPHHLFKFGGDREALRELSTVLAGAKSMLEFRAEQ